MAYITREDGVHFVIPSYRDVLTVKQKSQLKKEILLLSQSYGEFITLQKKSALQYEVAFSTETGYLLGESVWHYFKKPLDMVYCEAIPNSMEAILVIVKSGSVYLDGSFPLESIPEELIIFLTQQNNFEIYIYGDVPISQVPETGKFSFEHNSVKSFTILDKPIFPNVLLLKIYQLQLVDSVLKAQGIGVFPTKKIVTIAAIAGLVWMGWSYLKSEKIEISIPSKANPYQIFLSTLNSPAPDEEVTEFVNRLQVLFQIPGWELRDVKYIHSAINANVLSTGGKVEDLFAWASHHGTDVVITKKGITITQAFNLPKRPYPKTIYPATQVIALLADKLSNVYPGNNLTLGDFVKKGIFTDILVTIKFQSIAPVILNLIGQQLNGLPLVLHDITLTVDENINLTGSITIEALGN